MPERVSKPVRIPAPGEKLIEEWIGGASTGTKAFSIARMEAPPGWDEPFQQPQFDEVTIVLSGTMRVDHEGTEQDIGEGEMVLVRAGERIRYSNPSDDWCTYYAVCVPAFSVETVHRDTE
jgi:mannose-6-phosphate isomerase-like protein (cupin superfamily)